MSSWHDYVSQTLGWCYFLAWSVSFYPQVYMNWKRKSVVGLSFDFLILNITGYLNYSMYNCLMYFDQYLHDLYIDHFGDPFPIYPNDVFFALHGLLLTIITIVQCLIYEKNQQVAYIVMVIVALSWTASVIQLFLSIAGILSILQFVTYFSYVKIGVTLLKYIPQAYANYKRKSTVGWSIGNILLDTTGGLLSFFQIFLDGFVTGNWSVFEGGGAKFALSVISILFDLLFIIQHYVLYKNSNSDEQVKEAVVLPLEQPENKRTHL
eukprot:TRINITY_DN4409_c0_g2_i1.p1 TRINITY_DN4409_c0_g2~~TRINITY_DN4409_c0_g2_i1.p1  ORF type:complete len:265 (+),score=8.97 TRINITY_DN4409_c0_g2_i1:110-904(+)